MFLRILRALGIGHTPVTPSKTIPDAQQPVQVPSQRNTTTVAAQQSAPKPTIQSTTEEHDSSSSDAISTIAEHGSCILSTPPPFTPSALRVPAEDMLKPIFTPVGKWAWTAGLSFKSIEDLGRLHDDNTHLKKALVGEGHVVYIGQSWTKEDGRMFLNELVLRTRLLQPLCGTGVSSLIAANRYQDFYGINLEPPHAVFWVEASQDLPLILKNRCVDALAKVHAHGVLHGNLALRDFLIGADAEVTIINFGESRVLRSREAPSFVLRARDADLKAEMDAVKSLLQLDTHCQASVDVWKAALKLEAKERSLGYVGADSRLVVMPDVPPSTMIDAVTEFLALLERDGDAPTMTSSRKRRSSSPDDPSPRKRSNHSSHSPSIPDFDTTTQHDTSSETASSGNGEDTTVVDDASGHTSSEDGGSASSPKASLPDIATKKQVGRRSRGNRSVAVLIQPENDDPSLGWSRIEGRGRTRSTGQASKKSKSEEITSGVKESGSSTRTKKGQKRKRAPTGTDQTDMTLDDSSHASTTAHGMQLRPRKKARKAGPGVPNQPTSTQLKVAVVDG